MDRFLLVAILSMTCFSVFGQSALGAKAVPGAGVWRVKKIGFTFRQDQDMIKGLGHEYLLNSVDGPLGYDFSLLSFQKEDLYSMVCENPNLSMAIVLQPGQTSGWEISLAGVAIFDRIDAAHYNNSFEASPSSAQYKFLNFTNISNEVGVELGLARAVQLARSFFFYPGVGGGLGYSFDNQMQISGGNVPVADRQDAIVFRSNDNDEAAAAASFSDSYQARDSRSQRVFYSVGFGMLLFQRAELAVNYRAGIGRRTMIGGDGMPTQLKSIGCGINWHLR